MISEAIRSLIETKLNNNTASKVFVVGSYAYLEDKDEHFVYDLRNGYRTIETNFITCMIEFSADYSAIPSQINGLASITANFLVKAETQKLFDTDLATLDEFVSKIVGNHETITDGSTTYNSVWNMDAFMPAGDTKLINGNYYTQITTNIYVDFSDTNKYGNYYTTKLNGKDITAYDGSVNRDNEENYPHLQGNYEAKGGNKTSQWTTTLVSYLDTDLETIFEGISSDTYNMETVYTYAEYKNVTTKIHQIVN